MKRGGFRRWGGWLRADAPVRAPDRCRVPGEPDVLTEARVVADAGTLRLVVEGLNELQARVEQTEIVHTAEARGYLTPAEDDRVRRALLAYRNYRIALYEIILRLRGYGALKPAELQVKAFLVGFGAALTLYAKSIRLHELASRSRLVHGKLNEPEPKFDLAEGFFDEVTSAHCSLRNYGLILRALWFWSTRRRFIRALARAHPEPWGQLEALCARECRAVRSALKRVLRERLSNGWRTLWRTAFKPVNRLQYGLRSRIGGRFAGYWLRREQHRALDADGLRRLRAMLQPGDVLLMRSEGKLTAAMLPGFWAHAAIFLGTRAEIRDLLDGPEPVTEDDEEPGHVIEGVSPCVRIVSLKTCLDADHVLVLRPRLPAGEVRPALQEALRHLGKEYDFEFDFNLSHRIVCTGLIHRVFHDRGGIAFNLIKRLGNFTLTGDDVAAQALSMQREDGECFTPVALVLRRNDNWKFHEEPARIRTLARRIEKGWRPVRNAGA